MKKLLVYYFLSISPMAILYWLAHAHNSELFVFGLLIYVFIYRTLLDGYRLVKKGLISPKEIYKLAIPFLGFRYKYFKELYWK